MFKPSLVGISTKESLELDFYLSVDSQSTTDTESVALRSAKCPHRGSPQLAEQGKISRSNLFHLKINVEACSLPLLSAQRPKTDRSA